jgi:hypothetical protein
MGIIAKTVETTNHALGYKRFQDWFEPVHAAFFKHLPRYPEPHQALLERAKQVVDHARDKAEQEYRAGFTQRADALMGQLPGTGPPGPPENRPIRQPEDTGGTVLKHTI